MDSLFKVPVTRILRIEPHDNSHSLELAFVYGFQVVIPKDVYKAGDRIVYIPVDSILSNKIETLLFGANAKIKLTKGRLRQIKIRNKYSQGMIVNPVILSEMLNFDYVKDEQDVSSMLGITKYEPPEPKQQGTAQKPGSRKALAHDQFHSYNGLSNIKWMPTIFDDKEVIIQCKLHGTNARAAKLPYRANTLMKKIKKLFGLAPKYENLYGSNKVDITNSRGYSGYYGTDIYGETFKRINVFAKINCGETVFGEIIGPGIQKGYTYGLKEHTFVLFDVKVLEEDGKQRWLNPEEVEAYAKERGFEFVPVLYRGIYNKEMAYSLTRGPSVYCPEEPVREGIVIKDRYNYDNQGNKTAVKWINEDYLQDQSNTDNH